MEGGAFKYVETAPVFLTKGNLFTGSSNQALYGPNYAAYPVKMELRVLEPQGEDVNLAKMSTPFYSGLYY